MDLYYIYNNVITLFSLVISKIWWHDAPLIGEEFENETYSEASMMKPCTTTQLILVLIPISSGEINFHST